MTVSVVIPLYNKVDNIARAIDSVLGQTYADFELIIVDDGSTDGSTDVVRRYTDSRIRLIVQKNAGPGAARNSGMREANGEFITFLDADDELMPTFIEEGKRFFNQYGPQVASVFTNYVISNTGKAQLQDPDIVDGAYRLTADMPLQYGMKLLNCMCWPSSMSRTDCIRKWGGFFDRERCVRGEDTWLSFKVLFNETIAINLKPLYIYHKESSDLTAAQSWTLQPYIRYFEEIDADCPAILRRHLRYCMANAVRSAVHMLAWNSRYKEGRELLRKFECFSFLPFPTYL